MVFHRILAVIVAVNLLSGSSTAAERDLPGEVDPTPGWRRIGGFSGTSAKHLLGRLNDLLFETEATGSLYRDLGDITIGLGLPIEDGTLDWENSFFRRVLPIHDDIPPGGIVTGGDLSSYIDIKTLISRGRLGYDVLTDIVENAGAIGVQGEGGVSLTMGRIHPAIELGDRPLAEALDDPDRQLVDLGRAYPKDQSKSLLRLGVEGVAAALRWISTSIGRANSDTERSQIFYESYDDSVTLFIDLGVPVDAELFRGSDRRLGPGDFVRQVSFVGFSPVAAGIEIYGVELSYRRFYRFLRETTIVKESGGTVLVQIRTSMAEGNETTPFKLRPEVQLLGILTAGYTFFEQVFTGGPTVSYNAVYRIDLSNPRGMECFKAMLGDGMQPRLRPLREAAVEHDGAEELAAEIRRGINRNTLRRVRFFTLFNLRDWRIATTDLIDTDDDLTRETVFARNWSQLKGFGRRQDRSKRILMRSVVHVPADSGLRGGDRNTEAAATQIVTRIQDNHATSRLAATYIRLVGRMLDGVEHDVLEKLSATDPEQKTRFFLNLRLMLDRENVERITGVSERDVWRELAGILLGEDHRDLWETPEKRRLWRTHEAWFESDPLQLHLREMSAEKRYRLARRTAGKWTKLQRAASEGGCPSCLSDALGTWDSASMMQLLIARICRRNGGPGIGYRYEVFVDEMLRPVTAASDADVAPPIDGRIGDILGEAVARRAAGLEGRGESEKALTADLAGWQGDRFIEPSLPRLEGGEVLVNVGAEPLGGEAAPCWKLRLFSDVRFAPDLRLRVDLRDFKGMRADTPIGHALLPIGEFTDLVATPFLTSRYSYDIALPAAERLRGDHSYSLLLRVVNADGLTVSEEEQVTLRWPSGGVPSAEEICSSPSMVGD